MGGTEQEGGGEQTNQSNLSCDWKTLRGFLPTWLQVFLVILIIVELFIIIELFVPSEREA